MLPYLARRTAVSTWKTLRQTLLSRNTETLQHDDALPPQQLRAAGQPGRALLAAGGQHAADARRQHQPQVRHRAREVRWYPRVSKYLQGCQQLLMYIICAWGALKGPKSNFKPVHFSLCLGNFTLLVLKLILASKLSELVQFENRTANNQIARKRVKIRPKSKQCYCQALEQMFLGWLMLTS